MVLLIVGLLLTGLVPTISSQIEQQRVHETRKQLDEIQRALIGFAITKGRLPCPASPTSNGVESFAVGGGPANGACLLFNTGFVPAVTLGLVSTSGIGFAVDPWGNNIRYAVTDWDSTSPPPISNVFTSNSGMRTVGINALAPNLLVCSSASTSTSSCSVPNSSLTSSPGVPAVIYSTGKNGALGGTSPDETENPNPNSADNDRIFVSHPPTADFDDIVIWLSPNILINSMVSAGALP